MNITFGNLWAYPLTCAAVVLLYRLLQKPQRQKPLPPGPAGIPIIGSAHLIPKEKPWLAFDAWRKQYGDIVYLSALGKHIIILNSQSAVVDLLDRRGAIYAERPPLQMGVLTDWRDTLVLSRYDNFHRDIRKLMATHLTPRKVADYHTVIEQVTGKHLLKPLLHSPADFMQLVRNNVAATVLLINYGHEVTENDPLVKLAEDSIGQLSAIIAPGAFLVEIFPILQYLPEWFPGAKFKRTAKEWREYTIRFRESPYEGVKKQLKIGQARPSFAADLIQGNETPTAEEEYLYKWATGSVYAGGADTTVSGMSTFFLVMVLFPEVQKKAQEEIDRVTGNVRLPSFTDRNEMPYVEAILKELHRWSPVTPFAIPHYSTEDHSYAGYFIPKNSTVIANNWGIFHDETLYPSPFEFIPERYLENTGNAPLNDLSKKSDEVKIHLNPDPTNFAFGYGRRQCPGQALADASLWITIAMTLSVYNLSPITGANGEKIMPRVQYRHGTVSHPEDFECSISTRSEKAASLIENL